MKYFNKNIALTSKEGFLQFLILHVTMDLSPFSVKRNASW